MTFLLLLSSSFLVLSKLRITNNPTCSDHSSNIPTRCRARGVVSRRNDQELPHCSQHSCCRAPGGCRPPGLTAWPQHRGCRHTDTAQIQPCAGHWDGPVGTPSPHTALGRCPGFPADVPGALVPSRSSQPAEPERSLRLGSAPRRSPASQLGFWQRPRCTSPSVTDH